MDAFESTFEWVIFKIDENQKTIDEFDNETLFMNIYLFYCFSRYLSPYYNDWFFCFDLQGRRLGKSYN